MEQTELNTGNNGTASVQGGDRKSVPPYISFMMFLNHLEWLEKEGIPLRFDRSFWSRKYNGNNGPQLLSALRFLGLLDTGDVPQDSFQGLVNARGDDRKKILTKILQERYEHVSFDALPRATPGMFTEWMSKYPIEGETKRKTESFLVNALKFVDFPIAPAIKKRARNRPSKSTTSRTKNPEGNQIPPKEEPSGGGGGGNGNTNIKTVELLSGGSVSVALNVDLFTLTDSDRTFVVNLVDLMREYENDNLSDADDDDE